VVELPLEIVGDGAKFHGIFCRCECGLNGSICIDKCLSSKSIDLDGVTEVRVQQSVDWMHHT
jgi:hypothetical protein